MAVTGPSRPMLPVVGLGRCRGCGGAWLLLGGGGALGCRCRRRRGHAAVRPRSMAAPHCAAVAALARQPGHEGAGSLAGDRLRNLRRQRRPRVLAGIGRDDLLAGDAVDALAGRIGDIPDVGHLGAGLVLGGDDVAAQRVVGALVLAGRHGDALLLDRAREFLLDLLGDRIGRADDRRHRHLGQRRLWLRAAVWPRRVSCAARAVPAEQRGARLAAGQTETRQRHQDGKRHPRVRRRAAAASMVVTVTSPLLQRSR